MNDVRVTVAWITPTVQELIPVALPAGATVVMALDESRLVQHYRLDMALLRIGVNGRIASPDTVVADGDRVEIYRPLIADAKAVRRAQAAAKSMTKPSTQAKKQKI